MLTNPRRCLLRRAGLRGLAALVFLGVWFLSVGPASADPLVFWGARLTLTGYASGTLAPEDEGYFNYSTYDSSVLRRFRLSLAAEFTLAASTSILAELRSDNLAVPEAYALYLRVRPWSRHSFDIQAGLIPPVFGAFARRQYPADNPLPGLPLAYQYRTSLRADAVPDRAEGLVSRRSRGWRVSYPVGDPDASSGVPLMEAEEWDVGVEARIGRRPISLAVAVTRGVLSDPGREGETLTPQISARLVWRPTAALALGASGSTGLFLGREVTTALPDGTGGGRRQEALGADLELSKGHLTFRAEAILTRHGLPALEATRLEDPVQSFGAFGELRYKLAPGLFVAGRADWLGFGSIPTSAGPAAWEASVTRFEVGAGYAPRNGVLLKAAWQHDERDGGKVRRDDFAIGQVVLWF